MREFEGRVYKGIRIDKFLDSILKEDISNQIKESALLSRSFASDNVSDVIKINGKKVKKSYKIKENDKILLNGKLLEARINERIKEASMLDRVISESGELKIIFENKDYAIIDKPHGMVVHPGHNNTTGTLANLFKGYLESKGEYDPLLERGGVVHRLDKAVGGLILLAKNRSSQLYYKKLFEKHQVLKVYECKVEKVEDTYFTRLVEKAKKRDERDSMIDALVEEYKVKGFVTDNQWVRVGGYIGRDPNNRIKMLFLPDLIPSNKNKYREAISYIYPLSAQSFLVRIETGRMHQIRATLRSLGYVIKGDKLYRSGKWSRVERIELRSVLLGYKDEFDIGNIIKL